MAYRNSNPEQDFRFVVQLDFPGGFHDDLLADGAAQWLTSDQPNDYCPTGISVGYTGWRRPTAGSNVIFNNQDRLTFTHNPQANTITLWGTRRSTASLAAENVFGLGSNFRLSLEKALLFYATRIYHGSFKIRQIDYQTPVTESLGTNFSQQETLSADLLNQPFANRDHQVQLAAGVPASRDLFAVIDRFQQPLLVALKNFAGAASNNNRHRFDSSWRCLNTIYSTIFQRPMTAENRGDNDARTLQYLAEHVFSQSPAYQRANQLATDFVLQLKPRRVIKLVNDAARAEARYVDSHRADFAYPKMEKFNYAWQQLNFIVPFFRMLDDQGAVPADLVPLLNHFGPIIFRRKRNGEIVTYPDASSLDTDQAQEVARLATSCDDDRQRKMYQRYANGTTAFVSVVNAYHQHADDNISGVKPNPMMTLRIFFNYVRVLRNNYFHGGYSAEDFLIKDTNNQQEIAAIADILTEYNRVLLNQYAGELSQTGRDRRVDRISW